jgi:hypothetical protein
VCMWCVSGVVCVCVCMYVVCQWCSVCVYVVCQWCGVCLHVWMCEILN